VSRPDRHGMHNSLKRIICKHLDANGMLLLSLLLSLPFSHKLRPELSSAADPLSSNELSVIPYQPRRKGHHWLLKMHGYISAQEEIIITKDDCANFPSSRYKALGGLVRASLMTKPLLLVGFSLTDPNYLNIIATKLETRSTTLATRSMQPVGQILPLDSELVSPCVSWRAAWMFESAINVL
jgi:hypothetical protein